MAECMYVYCNQTKLQLNALQILLVLVLMHSVLHLTTYYHFLLYLNSKCRQCELCMSLCTPPQWWNAL